MGQNQTHAPQQGAILFDHPVGLGQQILRNGPAEFGSGAGIEHEFEFGRLLHRYPAART